MKKYQKLLIFTLFCYTLFSINWYRDYDKSTIKVVENTRELDPKESQEMLNYTKNKVYSEHTWETFKYYKSPIPGIRSSISFNDKIIKYTCIVKT